jgi:single-strand DNA-binding protein
MNQRSFAMNTCILMAKIVRNPELRYTQDTQIPFAQMLVEFQGARPEDPPSTLKVVGWGEKLAHEIQQNYTEGDNLIIEGRLSMNTIDRTEGFKEKRAELRASRLHRVEGLTTPTSTTSTTPITTDKVVPLTPQRSPKPPALVDEPYSDFAAPLVPETEERNLDDIPF